MPQYNELGHVIPSPDDAPDMVEAVQNLSLSNPGIIPVASTAEANAIRQAYMDVAANEHIVNPPPILIFDYTQRQLKVEDGVGGPWEYLAGSQHAAKITWRRESVPENPSTPLVLYGQEFLKATDGWAFSSAQNLVIPESGLYSITFDTNLTGAAASAGRSFFQFSTTDGQVSKRINATNENNWAGGLEIWDLRKGQQLRVQVYHEGGGARTWSGTMLIAMVAATPDW